MTKSWAASDQPGRKIPVASCALVRHVDGVNNEFPKRAFVLAAGFGTRMRPLSCDLPKPLMPLWNKPVIQRILEMLRDWGVCDVVINLHHGAHELLDFARRNPVPGLRLALSFEPEIIGTGGALRRAEWFVRQGSFWLVNSDIVAERLDPRPFVRAFHRRRCLATLWLHSTRGPRTVEMRNGWIRTFRAANPGTLHTYTFCGLHLLSPAILDWLPTEGFAGIIEAYERAMRGGWRIAGVCLPDAIWFDIGTPFQYLETHREFFPMIGKPFVVRAPTARVARAARVENSVIWDGAVLRSSARVQNAVIGRFAIVRGLVPYMALRADCALARSEQTTLRQLGLDPKKSTAVLLEPRGSARTFIRIEDDRRSVLLVRFDPARKENALYARQARFLARLRLPVPAVLLDQSAEERIWLKDLGSLDVQMAWPRMADSKRKQLYRTVVRHVARLHERGAEAARRARLPLMPPFNARLYRWEREYFAEEFLRRYIGCSEKMVHAALRDLTHCANRLLREPRVLVHRDLQSSNILIYRGRPYFIDFQGMRLGPAAYDLASLLCDPYLNLPVELQELLLAAYNAAARRPVEREIFRMASLQRLAQALGAYARLGRQPELHRFLKHIPAAVRQMMRALDLLNRCFSGLREALDYAAQVVALNRPRTQTDSVVVTPRRNPAF